MSKPTYPFSEVLKTYQPKNRHYLGRRVGEGKEGDLTQEVLFKVHQSLSTFRGDSRLSTWINRIAANTALDRLRKNLQVRIEKIHGN